MQHMKIQEYARAGTSRKYKKIDAFLAYMNLVWFYYEWWLWEGCTYV